MSALLLLRGRSTARLVIARPVPFDLLKASSTPPGTRWITVHPHGNKEERGHPVLIRESATHPGRYHVIGGAGGKLNHMTLDHVDPSKWKERRKEKLKQKREKLRQLKERGAIAGVEAGEKEISEASRKAKKEFVDTVAQKLGWDENWYRDAKSFEDEGQDPMAAKLAANAHLRSWTQRAKQAHKDVVERIRTDHEARVSSGLGNLSLDADPYKASDEEIDGAHMQARADDHLNHWQDLKNEANLKRSEIVATYQEVAKRLAVADPEDDEAVEELIAQGQRDEHPQVVKTLAALEDGKITPQVAAKRIQKFAQDVEEGDVELPEDQRAAAHSEVARLYDEAQSFRMTDPEAAKRLVQEAKRIAGDRGVTALDIIGQKSSDRLGYRAPKSKRAVEDVIASGDIDPQNLDSRIKDVGREIATTIEDGDRMGDRPVGVISALEQQKESLQLAKQEMKKGDQRLAAKHFLQSEKYALSAQRHAQREPEAQSMVLGMVKAMKDAHKSVADLKASGAIGAPDLDSDTITMDNARTLIVAKARMDEREKELKDVRKMLLDDPEQARQIARDAKRTNWDFDSEKADKAVEKEIRDILASTEHASHKALLDRLDDHDFFSSYGGGRQITEGAIAKYISQGRDAALSLLGQVIQGAPMLERTTLDLLGPKASAQMVADHLANRFEDSPEEFDAIKQGLINYHVTRGQQVADGALRACDAAMAQARDFEKIGVSSSYDLSEMERYNRLRLDAVNQAMSAVGVAWGELNMTAELNWALAAAKPSKEGLSLKPEDRSDANMIAISRSLGLRDGEYTIVPHMASRKGEVKSEGEIRIVGDGVNKVIRQPDASQLERARILNEIRSGGEDKDDYLPRGFAKRTTDTWNSPEARADRYTLHEDEVHNGLMDSGTDADAMYGHLERFIGQKWASGVPIEHLASRVAEAGERHQQEAFAEDAEGGDYTHAAARINALNAAREKLIKKFRLSGVGGNRALKMAERELRGLKLTGLPYPLQPQDTSRIGTQEVRDDETTKEAAHRAIAANPYGSLAFKPMAELTSSDNRHLRDYYLKYMTGDAPAWDEGAVAPGEEEEGDDEVDHSSFGDPLTGNDDTKANANDSRWKFYTAGMKRTEHAYASIQDHLKNQALRAFVQHHNGLRPDDEHLEMTEAPDPHGTARYYAAAPNESKEEINKLVMGGMSQDQAVSHHYTTRPYENAVNPSRATASIGARAEGHLAPIWNHVAESFVPGKAVKMMPNLSMSGRFVNQQRMIKAIRAVKRLGVFAGVGSGKTAISLGAFADAKMAGDVQSGLFAVPQNMQGQFGAEAATYIDPNSGIKVHAQPGTERTERGRIMASTGHHVAVTTHQSLRDDTVRAVAEHRGIDEEAAKELLRTEPRGVRKQMVHDAFKHKGWDHRFDYFCVDEGHEAVNRQGKENSILANVIDAISDNAKHYVALTGTPVKNDPSESYDWLSKIDPTRHPDAGLEDFMIRHGGIGQQVARIVETRRGQREKGIKDWGNMAIAESLQHHLNPYFYSTRVPLNTKLNEKNVKVELNAEHQARYNRVTELYSRAQTQRQRGVVDTEALKELSPESFRHIDADEHEGRAAELLTGLGMIRDAAYNRALHTGENNSKNEKLAEMINQYRSMDSQRTTPDGKPIKGRAGIVFTTGIEAAHAIKERLERDGHRVGLITGQMSAKEKEDVKLGFQPPDWKQNGEENAEHDILVCTNAVSAGADMPRGEFVIHHDVPPTAKTHEQRTARSHRLSNDVNVDMRNLVSDTPYELANLMRLERKYALADVFQNPSDNLDDSGMHHHINLLRAAAQNPGAQRRVRAAQVRRATTTHHYQGAKAGTTENAPAWRTPKLIQQQDGVSADEALQRSDEERRRHERTG